ncbi:MAG: LysR family transcriptional regulator [Phenylobacterium sp.]|uniref:LysR family transcriptional regulator n=1 Tax=Phenylobacterium sp. TaxID=1871053 RepID=UPI002A35F938|nr:LysR family transcriptional regulator [Phenylobacterium sp.]MDX9997224.1 LysR family transcriptional regulator [Phenylobacterium sp.]
MDRLDEVRLFVAVADALSFAGGARRLGVSPAQASKAVARLEDRLKARLLNRTTRDVSLTDTGRAYLERASELIAEFDALESSVRDVSGPRGLLKVTAPTSFGSVELECVILEFAKAHPEVSLEVSLTDRVTNLVEEGYDVAVRITRMSDSSLVARKLGEARIVTCAAPDYLQREGAPLSPLDLARHETILDLNLADPTLWTFGRGAERTEVRVHGRLRLSNAEACLAAARYGFGIARAPSFAAAEDLRAGRLTTLLCDHEPEPMPIYAVYPHARHLSAKVRVFVDHLVRHFSGPPRWEQGWT